MKAVDKQDSMEADTFPFIEFPARRNYEDAAQGFGASERGAKLGSLLVRGLVVERTVSRLSIRCRVVVVERRSRVSGWDMSWERWKCQRGRRMRWCSSGESDGTCGVQGRRTRSYKDVEDTVE